jgi:hypothetical protein
MIANYRSPAFNALALLFAVWASCFATAHCAPIPLLFVNTKTASSSIIKRVFLFPCSQFELLLNATIACGRRRPFSCFGHFGNAPFCLDCLRLQKRPFIYCSCSETPEPLWHRWLVIIPGAACFWCVRKIEHPRLQSASATLCHRLHTCLHAHLISIQRHQVHGLWTVSHCRGLKCTCLPM